MSNDQVAEMFSEIAIFLELKGENPFKARAYANGARTIERLAEPLTTIVAENRLADLKGVGEALQLKIQEMLSTGRLAYYDELKASIPAGLLEMMDIPGLGPKKVKAIYDKLGYTTLEALEKGCQEGQVAQLSGFGEKTQSKILEGIHFRRTYATRHLYSHALLAAEPILESLRGHPAVGRCSTAGSLRRCKEIVGDIDFVVSSREPKAVLDFFTGQEGIINIIARGDTKASIVLGGGIQADLRVVSNEEYPFALHYFTGSKEHNIVMRQRAIDRGLRLNEYGLFRSTEETRDPALRVPCVTEEELFEALDLAYIPPELREDGGEFEVAEEEELPRLIEWTDLKGSLHNHSIWSDGHHTLESVAEHMHELGLDYWAITDHSRSSFQANGLQPERLRRQMLDIRRINDGYAAAGSNFRLLTGSEVDILSEGRLDFDDDLLSELEVVVASVHQGFTLGEAEMTQRIITAVENPYVHILGHMTGRLLLQREAYKVNQKAVIDACAETGTWIELNANPYRFDMDWRLWSYAITKGVKCVINCDAHRNEHAGFLRLGANLARKGWLTKADVINTLPLAELRVELGRKRALLK